MKRGHASKIDAWLSYRAAKRGHSRVSAAKPGT